MCRDPLAATPFNPTLPSGDEFRSGGPILIWMSAIFGGGDAPSPPPLRQADPCECAPRERVSKGDMERAMDGDYSLDRARFHRQRAEHELDIGLIASSPAAARAHLELSSLHHRRARELDDHASGPLLRM